LILPVFDCQLLAGSHSYKNSSLKCLRPASEN
jgi:hypothetical protein